MRIDVIRLTEAPLAAAGGSLLASALLCAGMLTGCASLMSPNTNLEIAREEVMAARFSEDVFLLAGPELDDAGEALDDANRAWLRHGSREHVDELAMVVTERVAKARRTAAARVVELRRISQEPEMPR